VSFQGKLNDMIHIYFTCALVYMLEICTAVYSNHGNTALVCAVGREKRGKKERNNDNTMMNKRGASNIARIHVVPIAMSPIQGDTAGMQRASGCIRLASILTSVIPTGSFL